MKPAEKYRAWKAHRPEKPIFRTILFSMMAVLLAEVILLSTGIGLTNVSGRLNQNAKQIVNMQVRNRASYLQDMLIKAQELTDISTTINNLTQQMLQDGTISLDTMDQSSEAADPLMEAAAPYLVSALRARPVTGIFLVINTHDLAEKKVGSPMPSVYLRDLDPDARPSERKADLMIERSSAAVVKKLGITTDKSWSTALSYRGLTSGGFACTVFQTAWEDDEKLDAADYGRWLTQTYKLTGDERTAIAYSQPLILPDGTVYGVIGVEILTSYLETKMPYQELQDGGQGTYLLVSTTSGLSDPELFLTLMAGDGLDANVIDAGVEKITCRQTDGERWLTLNNETGYAAVQNLDLYSRNAPFSNEKWLLMGTVRSSILFRFARTVQQVITSAVLLTLLLGAVSSLLVSRGLARPAEQLYCEASVLSVSVLNFIGSHLLSFHPFQQFPGLPNHLQMHGTVIGRAFIQNPSPFGRLNIFQRGHQHRTIILFLQLHNARPNNAQLQMPGHGLPVRRYFLFILHFQIHISHGGRRYILGHAGKSHQTQGEFPTGTDLT